MKKILISLLNGDSLPDLLMHVIRYVMPSKNKELKKLLHFYWEVCPKTQPDGKLKQEMILMCNAIQHDLQHPNEYVRGATLRFLCKLKEPELLEPLLPHARACLDHRHAYVRKNAVFAIYSVYKVQEHLIPDAPELIETFLQDETDSTCKRNAFVALSNIDRDRSFAYFQKNFLSVNNSDSLLQLAFIEFIRKDAIKNPSLKPQYIRIIFELLEATSNSVVYEAATSLTVLTNSPSALTAAASKFIELAIKEADNNIKLIVLERVEKLHEKNPGVLDDSALDILRVLSSPDLDVRKKAIDISLKMVSSRNVEDVIKLFKKELSKTLEGNNYDKNNDYRQIIIQAIHTCAVNFVEIAASVVDLLLDVIGELSTTSAIDVISFVKEAVERFPNLTSSVVDRLIKSLDDISSGRVFRGALWIIGEYCLEEDEIKKAWLKISSSVGKLPILASEKRILNNEEEEEEEQKEQKDSKTVKKGPKILADGTYATESALDTPITPTSEKTKNPIRHLILEGDYFLATSLSSTLTKLVLRYSKISPENAKGVNAIRAGAMLIMVSILRVGDSDVVKKKIDEDSSDRIFSCIKFLADDSNQKIVEHSFLESTKSAFKTQVAYQVKKKEAKDKAEKEKGASQVDDTITFRQFSKATADSSTDTFEEDIQLASGTTSTDLEGLNSRLKKIVPLTGFSDPVYAEAYIKVNQFDIVLDVLLVNQTTDTLRNLSVEFATLGDLKIIEKPTTQNIGPRSFHNVQSTIKVSSADTGVVFGNIVYDGQAGNENTVVILNDLHVDIMDYIKPGQVTETQFRTMWYEFEWENKVNISSKLPTLHEYLSSLLSNTNMSCLTTGVTTGEDCNFLSANLCARSSFGEDALANLSIEKTKDGLITGHIRIRSKGQGLALSLGDRIAATERAAQTVELTTV